MGAGYNYIDQAMHDQFTWQMLAALCVLKVLTTTASFTSGTPGGLFAPVLFIGAMLGAAVCGFERTIAPGLTGPIGAYALVGMGTLFAGILRAPMTSVFMIVEVSGNYSIILPVMISNTIAYLVSRRFQHEALFDLLSQQDGTMLPSMEEERESELRSVEDAMRTADAVQLEPGTRIDTALARMAENGSDILLVPLDAGLWGGLTRADLEPAAGNGGGEKRVRDIAAPLARPYLYPDQSIETALRALRGRKFVPVVHRADPLRLEGVLALDDLLQALTSE
jgi:CIC family chloride channel protein